MSQYDNLDRYQRGLNQKIGYWEDQLADGSYMKITHKGTHYYIRTINFDAILKSECYDYFWWLTLHSDFVYNGTDILKDRYPDL